MITRLLEDGFAYQADNGDVFYNVSAFRAMASCPARISKSCVREYAWMCRT